MKLRLLLVYLTAWLLIMTGGLYWAEQHYEATEHDFMQRQSEQLRISHDSLLQGYQVAASSIKNFLIDDPAMMSLLAEAMTSTSEAQAAPLRQRVYNQLKLPYQRLATLGLQQLHLHTAQNISFLRMHQPDTFGDDLSDFRPAIAEVNRRHRPVFAFETGRIFHGYRFIYPLHHRDQHIGSIEVSIASDAISRELERFYPSAQFQILLSRADMQPKLFAGKQHHYTAFAADDRYLIPANSPSAERTQQVTSALPAQALHEGLSHHQPFSLEAHLQQHWIATFQPLFNHQQETVGWLVRLTTAPPLDQAHALLMSQRLLVVLFSLLLVVLLALLHSRTLGMRNETRRLKAITTHMREGLYLQDLQGRLTHANPAALSILGYRLDELLGQPLHQRIHREPDQQGGWLIPDGCDIFDTARQGQAFYSDHEFFCNKHGQVLQVEVAAAPLMQDNVIVGTFTLFRDITQRKQLEQGMKTARRLAEAQANERTRFLANMSHEIRTPLNGLLGMLDLTMHTRLTDEQREYLTIAQHTGHSLQELLDNILDITQLEHGQLQARSEPVELITLIDQVTRMLAASAQQKGLALQVHLHPDLPQRILTDAVRLKQLLINLLSNAIKYTDQGRVDLFASPDNSLNDGLALHFRIQDTGPGISEQDQESLFNLFHSEHQGHSGLGLYLCQQIVTLLHGEIGVDSTPGQGSSFWFTLPYAPQLNDITPSDSPSASLSGQRLLWVSPSATQDDHLAHSLHQWGIELEQAQTTEQAQQQLTQARDQQHPYRFILLDHALLREHGLQFWASWQALAPDSCLILLCELTHLHEVQRQYGQLSSHCLTTPISQEHLYQQLLNCIDGMPSMAQNQPFRST